MESNVNTALVCNENSVFQLRIMLKIAVPMEIV